MNSDSISPRSIISDKAREISNETRSGLLFGRVIHLLSSAKAFASSQMSLEVKQPVALRNRLIAAENLLLAFGELKRFPKDVLVKGLADIESWGNVEMKQEAERLLLEFGTSQDFSESEKIMALAAVLANGGAKSSQAAQKLLLDSGMLKKMPMNVLMKSLTDIWNRGNAQSKQAVEKLLLEIGKLDDFPEDQRIASTVILLHIGNAESKQTAGNLLLEFASLESFPKDVLVNSVMAVWDRGNVETKQSAEKLLLDLSRLESFPKETLVNSVIAIGAHGSGQLEQSAERLLLKIVDLEGFPKNEWVHLFVGVGAKGDERVQKFVGNLLLEFLKLESCLEPLRAGVAAFVLRTGSQQLKQAAEALLLEFGKLENFPKDVLVQNLTRLSGDKDVGVRKFVEKLLLEFGKLENFPKDVLVENLTRLWGDKDLEGRKCAEKLLLEFGQLENFPKDILIDYVIASWDAENDQSKQIAEPLLLEFAHSIVFPDSERIKAARFVLDEGSAQGKAAACSLLLEYGMSDQFSEEQRVLALRYVLQEQGSPEAMKKAESKLLEYGMADQFSGEQRVLALNHVLECQSSVEAKKKSENMLINFGNLVGFDNGQRILALGHVARLGTAGGKYTALSLLLGLGGFADFPHQHRMEALRWIFVFGDAIMKEEASALLLSFVEDEKISESLRVDASIDLLLYSSASMVARSAASACLMKLVFDNPDFDSVKLIDIAEIVAVAEDLPDELPALLAAVEVLINNPGDGIPPYLNIRKKGLDKANAIMDIDLDQYTSMHPLSLAGAFYALSGGYIQTPRARVEMPEASYEQLTGLLTQLKKQANFDGDGIQQNALFRSVGAENSSILNKIETAINSADIKTLFSEQHTKGFNRSSYELKSMVAHLDALRVHEQMDIGAIVELNEARVAHMRSVIAHNNQRLGDAFDVATLEMNDMVEWSKRLDAFALEINEWAQSGHLRRLEVNLSEQAISKLEAMRRLAEGLPEGALNDVQRSQRDLAESADAVLNCWVQGKLTPSALKTLAFMVNVVTCRSGKNAGIESGFLNTGLKAPANDIVLKELMGTDLQSFLRSQDQDNEPVRKEVMALAVEVYDVCLEQRQTTLNGDGPICRALVGEDNIVPDEQGARIISQPSHQGDYLKLVLADKLGLVYPGEKAPLDRHAELVYPQLRTSKMTGPMMLEELFELYTAEKLVVKLQGDWTAILQTPLKLYAEKQEVEWQLKAADAASDGVKFDDLKVQLEAVNNRIAVAEARATPLALALRRILIMEDLGTCFTYDDITYSENGITQLGVAKVLEKLGTLRRI